jgi:dipeptidyl aminopeptidase/acylaminoacyl peptidase
MPAMTALPATSSAPAPRAGRAVASRAPAFALLAALLLAPAAAPQGVLTPHDVARLRSVTAAAMSPDGARVAYVLSVPRTPMQDEDGTAWTELHVLDVASGASRPYVTGKSGVSGVRWTADGKGLAFLAKRGDDKHTALYVLPLDGGEASRVFALPGAISAYALAPDGKRVAAVAPEADDEAQKKAKDKGFAQEVYEEDYKLPRLWVGTLSSGTAATSGTAGTTGSGDEGKDAKPVMLKVEGAVGQVHWSPVDDRLAISVSPTPLIDDEMMQSRVRVVDAGSGAVLAAIENPGKLGQIAWSPDGTRIALVSAADLHDPQVGRILVVPAAGGVLRDVLPGYLGHVERLAWQDADTLLYTALQGTGSVFGEIGADGTGGKVIAGPGGPVLTDLSLARDGQSAAFLANAPSHPPELYTMRHGETGPARRTVSNAWLAERRLAPQEVVSFSARDGLPLEGVLIRPLDEVAGRRYPLILTVHGGPEACQSNGWLTGYASPGQMAAARGFAVFHCNYRGSTGRGVEFSKLGQGDPAGKEFDDLIDAVDHLIAIGLVDGSKVGVTGGSYGGYATAWLSTKYTDRIAAGVMALGISDKVSKTGTTDIPNEEFLVHARMRPWENWQFMLERSPVYHAEQCRTPVLILHGKDDPRVSPTQSRELHRHLKLHGQAPVRLVLYPGEGHGNRKAAGRLDFSLRQLQWLEHYLTGPGGAMPDMELDYGEPKNGEASSG